MLRARPVKAKAFLFDLDGTLVDTEVQWAHAIVDLVAARGGRADLADVLPTVVGRNWIDIDRALHARYPVLGDTTPETDAEDLRAYYARHARRPEEVIIPGSVDFLHRAARVAPCAIVSGSPHDDVVAAARLCGVADELAFVLGAGEYAAGKPDPSGYLRAAERLGVAPADCVVIEDSTVGVAAGVAAGMKVIALDRPAPVPPQFVGETWRVPDLSRMVFLDDGDLVAEAGDLDPAAFAASLAEGGAAR